jgi:hypothetical protein
MGFGVSRFQTMWLQFIISKYEAQRACTCVGKFFKDIFVRGPKV